MRYVEKWVSRKDRERGKGLDEISPITSYPFTDEEGLLINSSDEVLRRQGLIFGNPSRRRPLPVTIESCINFSLPGIKDRADHVGSRGDLRGKNIEGGDASHRFTGGKGQSLNRTYSDSQTREGARTDRNSPPIQVFKGTPPFPGSLFDRCQKPFLVSDRDVQEGFHDDPMIIDQSDAAARGGRINSKDFHRLLISCRGHWAAIK